MKAAKKKAVEQKNSLAMSNPSAKELHGSTGRWRVTAPENQWRYYMRIVELVKFVFGNANRPHA